MDFSKGLLTGVAITACAMLAVNPPSKRQMRHAKRRIMTQYHNMFR